MSAVGKLDNSGDFDENGQLVETPYRASLTKQKAAPVKVKAKAKPAQPIPEATQDLVRPRPLPPASATPPSCWAASATTRPAPPWWPP